MKTNLFLYFLLFTIITSCSYESKLKKSIERLESKKESNSLRLREGRKDYEFPVVDDSVINYIVESGYFKHIESLSIDDCPDITPAGFEKVAKLKNIETLTLDNLNIDDETLNNLLEELDSLGIVYVRNCKGISSTVVKEMPAFFDLNIDNCPNLKRVKLENNTDHFSLRIKNTINKKKFDLRIEDCKKVFTTFFNDYLSDSLEIYSDSGSYSASFYNCSFSGSPGEILSKFDNVKYMRIDDCSQEQLEIKDMSELKKVVVDQREAEARDEEEAEEYKWLKRASFENCPSLETIYLRSNYLKQVESINNNKLNYLGVFSNQQDFLINNIKCLKNLKYFEFYGSNLPDTLLQKVVNLPNLDGLRYFAIDTLTDEQLEIVCQTENLKNIKLSPLRDSSDLQQLLQIEGIRTIEMGESDLESVKIKSHETLEELRGRFSY